MCLIMYNGGYLITYGKNKNYKNYKKSWGKEINENFERNTCVV